jgi:hypothetical protein
MVTLQCGRYVGYSHLDFFSVNGREEHILPVALTPQILIKFSHKALISGGGDGLEKSL